nr:MAG TPA: Major head protein [Bacteriophage sp.]
MKREDLLAKGYTEEQVTDILNTLHSVSKDKDKQIADLQSEVLTKDEYVTKYNAAQHQLDEMNKANMTEQEKFEAMKKEAEANLRNSKIIVNKAKAKEILSGLDIDESLIDTLVSEDEQATINNANLLKNRFTTFKDTVEKQTRESITNLNVKPETTNVPQQDDGVMTLDKFYKMSNEEQIKFVNENPEAIQNLQ